MLETQIERVSRETVSEAELAHGKRVLGHALELQAETNAEIAALLSTAFAIGDPIEVLAQARARISAMTAPALKTLARRYLNRDARVLLVAGPHPPSDRRVRRLRAAYYALELRP
jgi:predicted Zn-dependent peptidase